MIEQPYLIFLGDVGNELYAKTAFGLRDWLPGVCIGQVRQRGCVVDLGIPDMTPAQARAAGARTLVIGIAPVGGALPDHWIPDLLAALQAGLDLAAGLHQKLADLPAVAAMARDHGRRLHDVRHCNRSFPVGTGQKRSGKRLLTVGTDCALGKKYTALAIARELRARGANADFRATGQTGILIAGGGVALDATVADFTAGAAEALSPANAADHWDIIEGQGSLFHPGYAGVTLALVHGSQPDAMVLCHDPTRREIGGYPDFAIPPLEEAIDTYLRAARLTNRRARFAGIALNTSKLSVADSATELAATAERLGLPCIDPIRTGVAPIVDALMSTHAC
ncbi:MAG TPA: N-acetyltransferase DgcN [Steroidobacteraceae bacterium]|nr:N-acetyltransferase DgcN [Steroidobacteraceae bacterium]